MSSDPQFELEELGLPASEAQVYLALTRNGPLAPSAIASLTEIPRSSVYPTLNSLVDKGLVEGGAGYGSRFKAVPAETALPALIRHEREQLSHRESLVKGLSGHLASLAEPTETVAEEVIEIIRNPRAVGERFERLQLEAERQIDVFVKAPVFVRPGNPAEEKSLRRGLRCRGLYEKAALDFPSVKPYLETWISKGEEVRVFDGELPHKLAIFDLQIVLMPLIRPGEQTKTVLIRHPQLARSLTLAFEHLWERSESIAPPKPRKISKPVPAHSDAKTPPHTKEAAPTEEEGNAVGLAAGRDGHQSSRRTKKLNP